MREVTASDIQEPMVLALVANVPLWLVRKLPVKLKKLDPLSVAEPSLGASIMLETGELALIVYGTVTENLLVELPANWNIEEGIRAVLDEIPVEKYVSWRATSVGRPLAR